MNSNYDFIIAGFQRCGTTSLSSTLNKLNDVKMTLPKEDPFFYKKVFKSKQKKYLYGNCAPHLTIFPDIYTELFTCHKDMKFIFLYRDPFERIFSACKFYEQTYGEKVNLNKVLINKYKDKRREKILDVQAQISNIINASLYFKVTKKLMNGLSISNDNVLFVNLNDADLLQKVCIFLNIENNNNIKLEDKKNSSEVTILGYFYYFIYLFLKLFPLRFRLLFDSQWSRRLADAMLFKRNSFHTNHDFNLSLQASEIIKRDYLLFKKHFINICK